MKKKISIRDVARKAGVSAATVSRTLSGNAKVSYELYNRIQKCAAELGYRAENNRRIMLLIPAMTSYYGYLGSILMPLTQELFRRNFHPVIEFEQYGRTSLDENNFAGVISLLFDDRVQNQAGGKSRLPWIGINSSSNLKEEIFRVGSDENQLIQLGLTHLSKLGHKKIALFTTSGDFMNHFFPTARHRAANDFCRMHEKEGITCTCYHVPAINQSILYKKIREFHQAGVTAFFGATEVYSMKLIRILCDLGIRVPEDISVISYEISNVSEHTIPRETTVIQDYSRLAAEAVNLLEERLAGRPGRNITVPGYLHIRESTGPCKQ